MFLRTSWSIIVRLICLTDKFLVSNSLRFAMLYHHWGSSSCLRTSFGKLTVHSRVFKKMYFFLWWCGSQGGELVRLLRGKLFGTECWELMAFLFSAFGIVLGFCSRGGHPLPRGPSHWLSMAGLPQSGHFYTVGDETHLTNRFCSELSTGLAKSEAHLLASLRLSMPSLALFNLSKLSSCPLVILCFHSSPSPPSRQWLICFQSL